MSSPGKDSIDSLFQNLGDCGLFQVFIVLAVHGAGVASVWASSFMAYGNYNPGWTCGSLDFLWSNTSLADHQNHSESPESTTIQNSCEAYEKCTDVVYDQDSSTIVSEWDLACNKSWILSMMLSLQGAGYILGNFASGILNNKIGRKQTHFWGLFFHAVFNLAAMFSFNWPMFTVMRFLLGVTAGSVSVTNYVYPMEFVTYKWRAIVTALPFSSIGSIIFALCAMLLRDWRLIHLATTVMTAVFCVFAFWSPESIRWLALKGQTEKAVQVVHKIGKINRRKPDNVDIIYTIAEHERIRKMKEDSKRYSILDLYRHGLAINTNIILFSWVCVVTVYVTIAFGIKALSGNFYLNLILFSLSPTITLPMLPFLLNKAGRRLTSLLLLGVACMCGVGLVVFDFVPSISTGGIGTRVLSLVLIVCIDAQWALVMLYCVELYPTPLRSLGYSYGSCVARLGGLIAPFLIPHDEQTAFISHIVLASILLTNWFLIPFLPETKGRNLDDYVTLDD